MTAPQLTSDLAVRTLSAPRTGHSGSTERAGRPTVPASPPATTAADTLDALFSRAARRRPEAFAVQEGGASLTYAKAELRATQLASVLVHGRVQLGDPVIVHCDDHRQSLVAQLAVLKAGGVCVPVPPGLDGAGLAAVRAVSGASTVLCSRATQDSWPRRCWTLALDDPDSWRRVTAHRTERALPLSHAHEAAYLLIPDERAGGPAGLLVDHRAWRLALTARTRAVGPAAPRVFVSGPPAGPRALSAMWWAFASTGSLCTLPSRGLPAEPAGTACAAVFSPEEYDAVLDSLRIRPRVVQLLGGAVPGELVARHFAALPGTRLRAEFAPSGGSLPWAAQEFSPQDCPQRSAGSLGTPVPEVRVRVLDRRGRALPAGQEGELCAAGAALPFETIHRPGRTVPPWADAPLLRSGLPGRRTADGALELAGPPVVA